MEDIYVASVETDRGTRERLRIFDTAGLGLGAANELPRHYLSFADGYVLVYDPDVPESFDAVVGIKKDIDKFRDKKEVGVVFISLIVNIIKITSHCSHVLHYDYGSSWNLSEFLRIMYRSHGRNNNVHPCTVGCPMY